MAKQSNKKSSPVYYPGDVSIVLNRSEDQAFILLYGKTGTKRQHISLEDLMILKKRYGDTLLGASPSNQQKFGLRRFIFLMSASRLGIILSR